MKILKIEQFKAYKVITDSKDYPEHTRFSADSWSVQMGESTEQVYDCAELEAEFQRLKRLNEN